MSRKIQTVIPDRVAEEIDKVIIEDRFADQSEFVRHCIREYLKLRELNAKDLEAAIEEIESVANDLLRERDSVDMGKEVLDKAAPLRAYLRKIS